MKPNKQDSPLLIAITGNIASGKTYAGNFFKKFGYKVVNSDKIGHDILKKSQIITKIEKLFGSRIIKNKKVDRKKLGKIVFNSPDKLKKLNKLIHPLIRKQLQKIIDNCQQSILFIEIPLLFENHLETAFDYVINISVDKQTQIERLKKHNNLNKTEIHKKINAQLPNSVKNEKADFILENNTSFAQFNMALKNFIKKIPNLKKKINKPQLADL